MCSIRLGLVLVLMCSFNVQLVAAESEDDFKIVDQQPADDRGFPWLCFVTSIAGLAGLYFFVLRRERQEEADVKSGRKKPEIPWYCRTCDRDVVGSECPRCHALNPFQHDPVE